MTYRATWMAFDIVSLREAGDGYWLALILEGERLGQFRFVTHTPVAGAEQMRASIHALAATFTAGVAALDQFHALEHAQASGDRIRRVVDVTAPLAAAA